MKIGDGERGGGEQSNVGVGRDMWFKRVKTGKLKRGKIEEKEEKREKEGRQKRELEIKKTVK